MSTYSLSYSIEKDLWNWVDALNNPFMGVNWIDNIDNEDDRKIANSVLGLKKQQAELILKPYLESKKIDPESRLNKFIEIARKNFDDKYEEAVKILEKISGQPMMSNSFDFYVTTFPRVPYFYNKREIFMYDSVEGFWGMPIDNFLHEGLHFQFTYYWRENSDSLVSKLSDEEFDYVKEALTIVLNDELKPILTIADHGYENQKEYRKILSDYWEKNHNFNKLVDFALLKLEDSFRN